MRSDFGIVGRPRCRVLLQRYSMEAVRGLGTETSNNARNDRPATGFGSGEFGGSMNPGGGRQGNPLRFDDRGGRVIEDDGQFFDMLDLCLIALRGYTKLYPSELAGSAIDGIRYNTAKYAR